MKRQFSMLAVGLAIALIGSSVPQTPASHSEYTNRLTSVENQPKAETMDTVITSDGKWGDTLKADVILRGA